MGSTAEILRRLINLWWPTVLLAAVGALVGLGYAFVTPATYVARAYVVVVAADPTESAEAVSYAQTYARVVPQGDVINAAAKGGNASATDLRRNVQASSSPDAPVIEITGSSGSPGHAADLANLMSAGLVSTANQHSSSTRMKLTILSPASPPDRPSSPRPMINLAVGAAVGILLGGLAALTGLDRFSDRNGPRRTAADSTAENFDVPSAGEAKTIDLTNHHMATGTEPSPVDYPAGADGNEQRSAAQR
jgi:capsular polysaccharide biosynthesis protein